MVSKEMHRLGSSRSCIRELFEYGNNKAAEIGAENVFDFSIGNPSVPAPAAVEQAILQLIKEETPVALHSYTSAVGLESTRKALAQNLNRRFNAGVDAKNFLLVSGAASALIACFRALATKKEDEFIAIAPFFPEYRVFVESSANATFKIVEADTDSFQINFDALTSAITANTKAVIVNSPNNPSGVVYTAQTITRLADILSQKSKEYGAPIFLITDEPYRELVYGDVTVPYIPAFYNNTLMCYSYSKSLSLPGERIGYVMVPPAVYDFQLLYNTVAGAARSMGHVCAPSLMQRVIELCVDVEPDVTIYQRNSALLYERMTQMGYRCAKPDGAFYLFFEAPCGLTGKEFSDMAKEKYNLLIVPGDDFGCPSHLRLSYCVPTARIEKALPLLEKLMTEVKSK